MEQDLVRTQSRLEALIGSLHGGLLVEDEQRHIAFVNRAFCDLFAIPAPPEALVGLDCSTAAEQLKGLFLDPDGFLRDITTLVAARTAVHAQRVETVDGRVFERDYVPVWAGAEYVGHMWHYRDVTAQVQEERRQQCQIAVSTTLAIQGIEIHAAARGVLAALGETFGWRFGGCWRFDVDSGRFTCAATWANPREEEEAAAAYVRACHALRPNVEQQLVSQVWRARSALWIEDLGREGYAPAELVGQLGLATGLYAPVRGARAALSIFEWVGSHRRPDEGLLSLANHAAGQFGRFLDAREFQDALRESEARSRAILDSALDAIVTIDHEGLVTEWNPAAEALFGHSREDVLGHPLAEAVIPEDLRESHATGLVRYAATGVGRVLGRRLEMPAMRKDGSLFPAEVSIARIERDGPAAFTAFIRDVTERTEVERLKRQFVSTVSHELRTPLTSIRGSLGLLAAGAVGELGEEARETVAIAERNTVRLIRLINDILDLERLEAGRFTLEIAPVELDVVLRRAVESVSAYAADRRVSIPAPQTGAVALGDEGRLVQVVVNLLSNAIRFSPEGSRVTLRVESGEGPHRVEVADEGSGVSAELRRQIFEPFFQVEGTDARQRGGSGLGLAICKALVEQQGGEIGVERQEAGEGSLFWFTVPRGER
ncbi:MAG: PAS domain S-box protein [Vicinamibacteria bacterium]